jgi:predicted metal-binding membrane protein
VSVFSGSGLAQPGGGGCGAALLLQRGQLALFVTLIFLTVGAWGFTIVQAQSMAGRMDVAVSPPVDDASSNPVGDMTAMDGMDTVPDTDTEPAVPTPAMAGMTGPEWSLGAFAAFMVAWAVMMAAMMLPAVTPLLLLYRTIAGNSMAGNTASIATWILVVGYLLIWSTVGVGVYALIRIAGHLARQFGTVGDERWAALALGTILAIAGLYQFTPLKHACLRQCQSPFGFIMGHWRSSKSGALRMGVVHGLYCLGCCWALFAVLVAAGVMSLAWMLLLTLVVFAEKVLPYGRRTAYGVGAAFLVLGVLVASGTVGIRGVI